MNARILVSFDRAQLSDLLSYLRHVAAPMHRDDGDEESAERVERYADAMERQTIGGGK